MVALLVLSLIGVGIHLFRPTLLLSLNLFNDFRFQWLLPNFRSFYVDKSLFLCSRTSLSGTSSRSLLKGIEMWKEETLLQVRLCA